MMRYKHRALLTLGSLIATSSLALAQGGRGLDAVFANPRGQRNWLYFGDGEGGFARTDVGGDADVTLGVALGFVDGDNHLDAVFANRNNPNLVCLGDGAGSFACSNIVEETIKSFGVALGFIDSDQNLDAIFANREAPSHVCVGDGAGGFSCSDLDGGDGWGGYDCVGIEFRMAACGNPVRGRRLDGLLREAARAHQ